MTVSDLYDEPVLVVVLSDFGRDAGLRFALRLAQLEAQEIGGRLPDDTAFYDEYRRLLLTVVGDLPFAKGKALQRYHAQQELLDQRILVGFPGGLTPTDVAPTLGVLALDAMVAPVARGVKQVIVALPCNTLAPAQWWLERRFAAGCDGLRETLKEGGVDPAPYAETLERIAAGVRVAFPTVPASVLRLVVARGGKRVLPLGTTEIVDVYREAATRLATPAEIVAPEGAWREHVLRAIQAGISGESGAMDAARESLEQLRREAQERFGNEVSLVEACTDLAFGVGLDSVDAYARVMVGDVYGNTL